MKFGRILIIVGFTVVLFGVLTAPVISDQSMTEAQSITAEIVGMDSDLYSDQDKDGLPDWYEVENNHTSVDRKDILVEVDYVMYHEPETNFSRAKEVFAQAPVNNPDGSKGIDLHVKVSDEPVSGNKTKPSMVHYMNNQYEDEYDKKLSGYYHVLVIDRLNDSLSYGKTASNINGMVINKRIDPCLTEKVFVHELGHQLGLWPDVYEGIDSTDKHYAEYPSVMNYNRHPGGCSIEDMKFSKGTGFNDWTVINNSLSERAPP